MEPNFIARPLDISDRDDPYSSLKQNFGKTFYEQGLNNFANASDLGFSDFRPTYYDHYPSHADEPQKTHEADNTHNLRVPVPREDLGNYPMNAAYNSLGLPHHNSGHYNPNHNSNFGFNGAKQQPFQHEHLGYPGYHHHHQQHFYQNQHHYDNQSQGPQQGNHGTNMEYYQHPRDMGDNHHADESLSMMWRDEPGKPMNYKNMQMNGFYNGDLNKMKANPGFVSYEQPNDARTYQNMHDLDAKRNHMMRMQQEMSMASTRKGMEPQQKGFNPMMSGPNALDLKVPVNKGNLGMVKYAAKMSPKKGVANIKADLDDDYEDGEDGYGDDKGRSTRGLRVLSLKVKDIVMQKKRTSYKEVAETLTHELRQKSNGKPLKEESKDEQNVKRRVYDALNVLIAAGVLRKEGKVVYCDQAMTGTGPNVKKQKDGKEKLLKDIEEAKKRNKAKIELLHELVFKCLAIKNLIKKNKEKLEAEGDPDKKPKPRASSVSATRIEVIQENPSLRPKNEDVIRFPFIVLLSSSAENSMNLNMDTMQKQLAIESKKPFNIFGDIDVLLKMGLHYVTRKMFDENIPVELQKFVPKYFLAALN